MEKGKKNHPECVLCMPTPQIISLLTLTLVHMMWYEESNPGNMTQHVQNAVCIQDPILRNKSNATSGQQKYIMMPAQPCGSLSLSHSLTLINDRCTWIWCRGMSFGIVILEFKGMWTPDLAQVPSNFTLHSPHGIPYTKRSRLYFEFEDWLTWKWFEIASCYLGV